MTQAGYKTQEWEFKIAGSVDIQLAWDQLTQQRALNTISDIDRSLLRTMISELGTNIVKYAGRGVIRVALSHGSLGSDFDVWAEDKGPGIKDLDKAMQDNVSSSGTLGLGLPGVKRMSDNFWIRSDKRGTLVFARKHLSRGDQRLSLFDDRVPSNVSANPGIEIQCKQDSHLRLCSGLRSYYGSPYNGDAVFCERDDDRYVIALIDGSGHGKTAAEAADRASKTLAEHAFRDIPQILSALDEALAGTVGAAVGIFELNIKTRSGNYSGIGNIRASRVSGTSWHGLSRDGILGHRLPTPREHHFQFNVGDRFLMCSDGFPDYDSRKYAQKNSHQDLPDVLQGLFEQCGKLYDDNGALLVEVAA
jgi:anti-sigma regulatory factor (Ser/Thr protein kinase)/serine/threonine protein phosphatase PrpC